MLCIYISIIRRYNWLALCSGMESYTFHVWCDLTIGCKLQDCVHVHVFRKQTFLKELTCVQIPIFYCCLHSCADNIYVNVEKMMGFVEIVDIEGEKWIQETLQPPFRPFHPHHPPKHAKCMCQCHTYCWRFGANQVLHCQYYQIFSITSGDFFTDCQK